MFSFINTNKISIGEIQSFQLRRLTALWGFSEAAVGGILHAFKVPVTGLFLGSFAVIFISLIFYYSKDPYEILRATLIVILVKFFVSPYSPITAYFAVLLQGILGFTLFYFKILFKTSAIVLGILALLSTAIQKVLIYTLLFGFTFWKSINVFYRLVLEQFFNSTKGLAEVNISILIIGVYIFLHIVLGIYAGIVAGNLPDWIDKYHDELKNQLHYDTSANLKIPPKGKRKQWWRRKSSIIIVVLILGLLALSYLYPEFGENHIVNILIMLLRAFAILFIWLILVLPIVNKLFKKFAKKKGNKYSEEINNIVSLFPQFKLIIKKGWELSQYKKGFSKLKYFFTIVFIFLLKYE